jgi:hypothetical protein
MYGTVIQELSEWSRPPNVTKDSPALTNFPAVAVQPEHRSSVNNAPHAAGVTFSERRRYRLMFRLAPVARVASRWGKLPLARGGAANPTPQLEVWGGQVMRPVVRDAVVDIA